MATSASDLDLDELLMRATRSLRRRWAAALGGWDLTPHHVRALQVVGDLAEPRLGAIAERLRIAPRSATEVVDALEARALVARIPDPVDRRAICVTLTADGRRVLDEVGVARGAASAEHFAALTAGERAELAALLGKLDDRAGGRHPG